MASTSFTDGVTTIRASWLNDVNSVTYSGLFTSSANCTYTATGSSSAHKFYYNPYGTAMELMRIVGTASPTTYLQITSGSPMVIAAKSTVTEDINMQITPLNNGVLQVGGNGLYLTKLGSTLHVAEGTNGMMGTVDLVGGTATVANTNVWVNSRIFLTSQIAGGTPGWLRVSNIVSNTSFTITSSSATDTSKVAYLILSV